MHTQPMADSEGTFSGYQPSSRPCRECGQTTVEFRIWESNDGAYEDEKYHCKSCGATWWVDGIDS